MLKSYYIVVDRLGIFMSGNLKRKDNDSKDDRLQLRISSTKKDIIAKAAKLEKKSLSEFVLDQAYEQAQRILSDNGQYVLTEAQWEHFINALEEPPKDLSALRKLFATPDIFTEE